MYHLQPGKEPRYYQSGLANDAIRALGEFDSVCIQGATGIGKTVLASMIVARFLNKFTEKCVILTFHEESLLHSMRRTLFTFYGIVAQIINADTKVARPGQVYVTMAMTMQNRLKLPSYQQLFSNCGMLICDEVHRGEHRDIEAYFKLKLPPGLTFAHWLQLSEEDREAIAKSPDSVPLFPELKYVGLTATPKNATPRDPLKNHYQTIVCGTSISELIEWNKIHPAEGLVQNLTYSVNTEIKRSSLKINSRGEYDDTFQGKILKQPKYIENTFKEYESRAFGKKTIVFNSSIEHSQDVDEYFYKQGLPSRHLDGKNWPSDRNAAIKRYGRAFKNYDDWRDNCMLWLKETDGAILHNCGVLGTGFDEPSIEVVIVNKFVNSMPHLIQIEGRGSRPFPGKRFFIIIDMYGNNRKENHGDWSEPRDWAGIFHNPKKAGNGTAPTKNCPECGYINPAGVGICRGEKKGEFHNPPTFIDMIACGYIFPEREQADEKPLELKLITKGVNVAEVIKLLEEKGIGSGKYGPLRELIKANAVKVKKETETITQAQADELLLIAIGQVKEYCKIHATNCTKFFKDLTKNTLFTEIKRLFPEFDYTPIEWKKRDYVTDLATELEDI